MGQVRHDHFRGQSSKTAYVGFELAVMLEVRDQSGIAEELALFAQMNSAVPKEIVV